jgi:hypothetical protein
LPVGAGCTWTASNKKKRTEARRVRERQRATAFNYSIPLFYLGISGIRHVNIIIVRFISHIVVVAAAASIVVLVTVVETAEVIDVVRFELCCIVCVGRFNVDSTQVL